MVFFVVALAASYVLARCVALWAAGFAVVVVVFDVVAALDMVEFEAVCAKAGAVTIARAAAPRRSVFIVLDPYPRRCGSGSISLSI